MKEEAMQSLTGQPAQPAEAGEDRLRRTLAEVLGVSDEALSDESSPETVESWDSLNHLNVVLAVESEFGVNLSAEEALEMRDVGAIRGILRGHGAEV